MDTSVHGNLVPNNMGNIHLVHQRISKSCSNSNNYGGSKQNIRNAYTETDTEVYCNLVFSKHRILHSGNGRSDRNNNGLSNQMSSHMGSRYLLFNSNCLKQISSQVGSSSPGKIRFYILFLKS